MSKTEEAIREAEELIKDATITREHPDKVESVEYCDRLIAALRHLISEARKVERVRTILEHMRLIPWHRSKKIWRYELDQPLAILSAPDAETEVPNE